MKAPVPLSVTEGSEAEALLRFEGCAPEATRSALGMSASRVGDAVVLSMRKDSTRFWSKALGFGRTAHDRRGVCLLPEGGDFSGRPPARALGDTRGLEGDLRREDLTGGSSYVKLVAEVEEVVALADAPERRWAEGLHAAPVEPGDAGRWASVMMRGFGTPVDHYAEMAAATAVHPDWYPHAAWPEGEIVGAGTMYRSGDAAQLFAGAVLPQARNRGGHTELLAARARLAGELGCRLLIAETGAETDGEHNPSLHTFFSQHAPPRLPRGLRAAGLGGAAGGLNVGGADARREPRLRPNTCDKYSALGTTKGGPQRDHQLDHRCQ